jgi:hypothetical protein
MQPFDQYDGVFFPGLSSLKYNRISLENLPDQHFIKHVELIKTIMIVYY